MFSLIITVIAISLVSAILVASVYFGGDTFDQGRGKTEGVTVINQARQIQGAMVIARAEEGVYPEVIRDTDPATTDLAPEHIEFIPDPPRNASQDDYSVTGNGEVVLTMNGRGYDDICDSINRTVDLPVSASGYPSDAGSLSGAKYGCYQNGGDPIFVFSPK